MLCKKGVGVLDNKKVGSGMFDRCNVCNQFVFGSGRSFEGLVVCNGCRNRILTFWHLKNKEIDRKMS